MADGFPRAFGKYTLLEHLAQGGMGSLYLAYQGEAGMEKLCVVKTVLRELADKEYIARFRDEAKVVVRLSHGNLVPVFDAGNVEGELYIAMDHVDGKDLRAVWNRCAAKGIAFPVDVAIYLIKELARGLYHAHTAGSLQLVHRDVSPPNVLLAYSGEVKLTDFGLASSTLKLERTAPGVIYGKVSYMAPEQARGEPLDGRADLYAAGVILWELLTGRQLFPNSDGDALARVRNPQIVRPSMRASRVSQVLDGIVMKALAVERGDRYTDCEAFRSALAAHLAREAPTTDTARVAAFLRDLFGEEIERDRERREKLIEEARHALAAKKSPAAAAPATARGDMSSSTQREEGGPEEEDADGEPDADGRKKDRSAGVLGTELDARYRVLRLIGEGGMGRVYEGEHIEVGRRVAIKVLHPSYTRLPEVVARFRREARAASRIGHPNIVDVTDSGTTEGGAVYFVMEFLEGSDLADVIEREKCLGVDRAVHIALQLARALEAAHAADVIHRDLKPENIFLVARPGQPDFVKVLDFGIARHLEMDRGSLRLTKPDVAMGTPEYMAPEQAAGKPADERADIYAAGAILYEMLTGNSPHPGENAMEVLNKKATEVPTPVLQMRPDVSPELSNVIARTLARDPMARQQTMSELARDLERCRPDRRTGARGGNVGARRSRVSEWAPSTTPARAAVAGAALLVVCITGGIVWKVRSWIASPSEPEVAAVDTPATPHRSGAGAPSPTVGSERTVAARAVDRPTATSIHSGAGSDAAAPARPAPPPARSTPLAPTARAGSARRGPPTAAEAKKSLDEANRLMRDHQLAQAERVYQRLYDSGVEKVAAATGLAKVAFEAGRYGDAVKNGERAVRLGGKIPAHMVLGDAYFKVQRYADAIREYRAVLKQKPDHSDAQKRLSAALQRAS